MRRQSPRKSRWGEVLDELAVQQNLLHELLVSEESRSNSASRSRSPQTHGDATPWRARGFTDEHPPSAARRCLVSPSPDPLDVAVVPKPGSSLRSGPSSLRGVHVANTPEAEAAEQTTRGHPAGPQATDTKKDAVAHLLEALSTSSWSSEGNEPEHTHDTHSSQPGLDNEAMCDDVDRGARHHFYAEAMRMVDEEYDHRQTVVLQEMMNFTELSSVYLLTTYTSSTPERL